MKTAAESLAELFSPEILSHPAGRCGHGRNEHCRHLPAELATLRELPELDGAEEALQPSESDAAAMVALPMDDDEHQAVKPAPKRAQTRTKTRKTNPR